MNYYSEELKKSCDVWPPTDGTGQTTIRVGEIWEKQWDSNRKKDKLEIIHIKPWTVLMDVVITYKYIETDIEKHLGKTYSSTYNSFINYYKK